MNNPIRIERYSFSMCCAIITKERRQNIILRDSPDIYFRTQRLTCNVPRKGLIIVHAIAISRKIVMKSIDGFLLDHEDTTPIDWSIGPDTPIQLEARWEGDANAFETAKMPLIVFSFKGPAEEMLP